MKKIIPLIVVIALVCSFFCSCGTSDAAKAVIAQIDAIEDVNLDSLDAIEKAEKAYAVLIGEDKGDVKNYEKLTEARATYNKLKDFSDKVTSLIQKYDKTFVEYGISYTAISEESAEIKNIMDASDGSLKEKYEAIYAPVAEKEAKYKEVADKSLMSAESYIKGFYEINKENKSAITVKEIGCIAQISDGETYFMFAVVYDENGVEKKVYAKARFANAPTVESMVKYADNFYCDAPASEKTNALISGNVIIDVNAVLQGIS